MQSAALDASASSPSTAPATTTTAAALSLLKLTAGVLLALSAFAGSLVPELLMRAARPGEFTLLILPVGNALSAGLLFGAGMMHFFSEGGAALARSAAAASAACAVTSKPDTLACIHDAAEAGSATAAPAMMIGFLVSLVLDRVVLERLKRNRSLPEWMHAHSHSHGSSDHDHDHDHSPSSAGGGGGAVAGAVPTAAPVVIAAGGGGALAEHAAGLESSSNRQQQPPPHHIVGAATTSSTASVTLTIAVLMSLHSAIEGTTLALESSAKTLRGAFVPLFIHRFFDGVVVGLQATVSSGGGGGAGVAGVEGTSATAAGADSGSAQSHDHHPFHSIANFIRELRRITFRRATLWLLAWSSITPAVLLIVLLVTGGGGSSAGSGANNIPGRGGADGGGGGDASFAGAWAQCFAAGSFVYISAELLNDVFSRSASSAAAAAGATDWVSRNIGNATARVLGLLGGVSVVLLLEATEG